MVYYYYHQSFAFRNTFEMNLKKVGNNSYRISCHRPSPDYNPAFMSSPSPRLVTLVIS